jgi:hypothetical protein
VNTSTKRPALRSDAATGPHVPEVSRRLTRCARRPLPGSLVGGVVLAGAHAEHAGKSLRALVRQRILAALDALQDRTRTGSPPRWVT